MPGRARAADGLSTRASLIAFSRNCQPASPPGLQPPPFVRGAPSPLLLAPQTARCACSRRKNVRGCTDALRICATSWSCFPCNRALKAAHSLYSPCGRGLHGPSKFFRHCWIQVRFSGTGRGSRAATNTLQTLFHIHTLTPPTHNLLLGIWNFILLCLL